MEPGIMGAAPVRASRREHPAVELAALEHRALDFRKPEQGQQPAAVRSAPAQTQP